MSRRIEVIAIVLALVSAGCASTRPATPSTAPAPGDPWFVRSQTQAFRPLFQAGGPYAIEYPASEWLATTGGEAVVASLTQEDGEASVIVERSAMAQPLGPEEITEVFAEIETDIVRERHPQATDFETRLLEAEGRKIAAVEYTRPGVAAPERVRQYSIPVGATLYRIVCAARAPSFPVHAPTFAHIAASFQVRDAEPLQDGESSSR